MSLGACVTVLSHEIQKKKKKLLLSFFVLCLEKVKLEFVDNEQAHIVPSKLC